MNALATVVNEETEISLPTGQVSIPVKGGDPIVVDGILSEEELNLHFLLNEDIINLARRASESEIGANKRISRYISDLDTVLNSAGEPAQPGSIVSGYLGLVMTAQDQLFANGATEISQAMLYEQILTNRIKDEQDAIQAVRDEFYEEVQDELAQVLDEFVDVCNEIVASRSMQRDIEAAIAEQEDAHAALSGILDSPLGQWLNSNALLDPDRLDRVVGSGPKHLIDRENWGNATSQFKSNIGSTARNSLPEDLDFSDALAAANAAHDAFLKFQSAEAAFPKPFQKFLKLKAGSAIQNDREWWGSIFKSAATFILTEVVITGVLVFATGGAAGVAKLVISTANVVKNSASMARKLATSAQYRSLLTKQAGGGLAREVAIESLDHLSGGAVGLLLTARELPNLARVVRSGSIYSGRSVNNGKRKEVQVTCSINGTCQVSLG